MMISRFGFKFSTHAPLRLTGSVAFALIALAAVGVPVAEPAPTYTVLSNLGANVGDPILPMTILAQGRDGNLYGTSTAGGANGYGTVFQLTPAGRVQVVHSFNGRDGSIGSAASIVSSNGLTLGTDGSFYGTTFAGGESVQGVIFKISTDGTFTMLHNFVGGEGCCATSPPIQGKDGNLYGVTGNGNGSTANFDGAVYKITPAGTLTILYRFDNSNPAPVALTLGTDGNFYGTTLGRGSGPVGGTVFKITPEGSLTVLHTFKGAEDGLHPWGPIIQATDGNLYGTTRQGGSGGYGAVYKVTPAGVLTDIFNFRGVDLLGHNPTAGLVEATDGKFYGGTPGFLSGVGNPRGMLFQLTPSGNYSVVHNFPAEAPSNSLFQHTNGTLYGANYEGGSKFRGDVYSLNMGLEPFVRFLPPDSSASSGDTIGLLGQGFNGTAAVSFNGSSASFTVVSDTYLTATIPSGATTGRVTVTTSRGTLTSNKTFGVVTPQSTSTAPGPAGTASPVVIPADIPATDTPVAAPPAPEAPQPDAPPMAPDSHFVALIACTADYDTATLNIEVAGTIEGVPLETLLQDAWTETANSLHDADLVSANGAKSFSLDAGARIQQGGQLSPDAGYRYGAPPSIGEPTCTPS
jgi:uncharacterized repeat protein (TIGR03803 family)